MPSQTRLSYNKRAHLMKLSFLSLAHGTFPDRGIDIEVAPHGLKEIGFIGEVVHGSSWFPCGSIDATS